jgi:hypothetical protein
VSSSNARYTKQEHIKGNPIGQHFLCNVRFGSKAEVELTKSNFRTTLQSRHPVGGWHVSFAPNPPKRAPRGIRIPADGVLCADLVPGITNRYRSPSFETAVSRPPQDEVLTR